MNNSIKKLNNLMLVFIAILTTISFFTITIIQFNLFSYKISLSLDGLKFYLNTIGNYKTLFAGTIATCTAFFGFLQIQISSLQVKASVDATNNKMKNDSFIEWITTLQIRMNELGKNNHTMLNEINLRRKLIFNSIYELNFNIKEKQQLITFFDTHFKHNVPLFEKQNKKYQDNGGAYASYDHSYTYPDFEFMFLGILDEFYQELKNDLRELYIANLPNDRKPNKEEYDEAVKNYMLDKKKK